MAKITRRIPASKFYQMNDKIAETFGEKTSPQVQHDVMKSSDFSKSFQKHLIYIKY